MRSLIEECSSTTAWLRTNRVDGFLLEKLLQIDQALGYAANNNGFMK